MLPLKEQLGFFIEQIIEVLNQRTEKHGQDPQDICVSMPTKEKMSSPPRPKHRSDEEWENVRKNVLTLEPTFGVGMATKPDEDFVPRGEQEALTLNRRQQKVPSSVFRKFDQVDEPVPGQINSRLG